MKRKIPFLSLFITCVLCGNAAAFNPIYGRESLRGLLGVQVMVHCAGDTNLQSLENEIRKILEKRLREMSVPAVIYSDSGNAGALKLLLTGIKSGGKYYTYATLQLHQRAYLAASHNFMDCQTWDAWKMGVFNEREILDEADDLAREFANDFISANLF